MLNPLMEGFLAVNGPFSLGEMQAVLELLYSIVETPYKQQALAASGERFTLRIAKTEKQPRIYQKCCTRFVN
jgi:hypothetical protein